MPENTMKWTGENCTEISNFLGHENFHHKNGDLFVETNEATFTVHKGETFGKNEQGEVFPFIDPHGERPIIDLKDVLEQRLRDGIRIITIEPPIASKELVGALRKCLPER